MKIGVLFNCQHHGISRSLQALLPQDEVISFGFPELTRDGYAAPIEARQMLGRCDLVVALDDPEARGPLSAAAVMRWARRSVVIPPVIFGGFHPDTCYVTRGDLRGPTNAIHSRIVIAGFLAGLGADDVAALYNRLVFARLGYFTSFAEQRALLEAAYAARGIELAPWFDAWLRQGCFMHSVNHPKVHVLFDIARIVCRQAGLTVDEAAACPEDDLAAMARHPVHRDLARAFGVAPEDRFYPPAPKGRQPAPMPLEQYIDRSFALYATARPSALRSVDGVREALRTLHEN